MHNKALKDTGIFYAIKYESFNSKSHAEILSVYLRGSTMQKQKNRDKTTPQIQTLRTNLKRFVNFEHVGKALLVHRLHLPRPP